MGTLMHFNLANWLFTDPCSATSCVAASSGVPGVPPEMFHFYIPWLIFCSLGVLVAFYYSVEGRKRFVKNKPVVKYMFDRYLGWFAIICILLLRVASVALYVAARFGDMGHYMGYLPGAQISTRACKLPGSPETAAVYSKG
jgi:hypothetical protein